MPLMPIPPIPTKWMGPISRGSLMVDSLTSSSANAAFWRSCGSNQLRQVTGCPAFAGHDKTNSPLFQLLQGNDRRSACRTKPVAPADFVTERTFALQIREAAAIGRGQDREARRIERHPMAGEAMQHLRRRLGNAFWRLCKPASGSAKAVNEHCSF